MKALSHLQKAVLTLLCFAGSFVYTLPLNAQVNWRANLVSYINDKLARPDGGYGWADQYDSHLSPTFAVIGILKDLELLPADKRTLIEFVKTHHPQRTTNKETGPSGFAARNLLYDQIQSLAWLGADLSDFEKELTDLKPDTLNLYNYETHHNGVLDFEVKTVACKYLLKPDTLSASFLKYLLTRRRENGSFNNAPSSAGGDGNMLNTFWGLYALKMAGAQRAKMVKTAKWLQACQLKNGGFTHQPFPTIGGNDEVAYTWAAVKSLHILQQKPLNEKACVTYLLSLRNTDGGFGNRPGLSSTPMSTYYAIDALKELNAFSDLDKAVAVKASTVRKKSLDGLKVFTVQFQAHGTGSPTEAVMLADSLKIDLWGAKNDNPEWINEARQIAAEKKVPVTFFTCDEPYGKNVSLDGMGTFGHILDFFSPAKEPVPALAEVTSWPDYRKNFIEPLLKNNGALLLQISNNEPMARMILDESVSKSGYAAISTIHFHQNFLFFLPFLYQYRYQIPLVSLQDAHGQEAWWWTAELLDHRTLFLGSEASYDEMMNALKNNWVVAVRNDSVSQFKTRMLGGAEGVQEYIKSIEKQWKWWNKPGEYNRPWAAITIVKPVDSLEVARPEKGVNIRIRCWRSTNRQLVKEEIIKLDNLKIDNVSVKAVFVEKRDRRGMLEDCYYLYSIPEPSSGSHLVETTFTNVKNNTTRKGKNISFTYP